MRSQELFRVRVGLSLAVFLLPATSLAQTVVYGAPQFEPGQLSEEPEVEASAGFQAAQTNSGQTSYGARLRVETGTELVLDGYENHDRTARAMVLTPRAEVALEVREAVPTDGPDAAPQVATTEVHLDTIVPLRLSFSPMTAADRPRGSGQGAVDILVPSYHYRLNRDIGMERNLVRLLMARLNSAGATRVVGSQTQIEGRLQVEVGAELGEILFTDMNGSTGSSAFSPFARAAASLGLSVDDFMRIVVSLEGEFGVAPSGASAGGGAMYSRAVGVLRVIFPQIAGTPIFAGLEGRLEHEGVSNVPGLSGGTPADERSREAATVSVDAGLAF